MRVECHIFKLKPENQGLADVYIYVNNRQITLLSLEAENVQTTGK